jgi:hypothetical protein
LDSMLHAWEPKIYLDRYPEKSMYSKFVESDKKGLDS